MRRVFVALCCLLACSQPASSPSSTSGTGPSAPPQRKQGARTISIIGTNDLHGALDRLPLFAGYVTNLRAARAADGGGVVLLDGGDMFQGTLESNLNEGAAVIHAYNAIGYTAAAVGNHEFDFGPEGPLTVPRSIEDDARGALKARAAEAKFPLLVANISDTQSGNRIKWPNMPPSTIVEVAGLKLGLIGASTEATPFTTMPANFAGLVMKPPIAIAIIEEAKQLRAQGAQLVLVTAHIGTRCNDLDHPNNTESCERNEELIKLIEELPRNTVDVIVAGHTHAAVAHRINDIAVIESYSSGRAFGRVDLRVSADGHVTSVKIHKPRMLCEGEPTGANAGNPLPLSACSPGTYEGQPVTPVAEIQQIVDAAVGPAAKIRDEKLGITLGGPVTKSYGSESAQGNWITDLMLQANRGTHVAVTNGGGLRADIPAGPLTYGGLYEAMPFDNRFALVDVKGAHLRKLVTSNLQRGGGILSWGGLSARAYCQGAVLEIEIKVGGKPLADTASYKLVTSDFLASGGDGLIGRLKLPEGAVKVTDVIMRDAIAALLRTRKGTIDPATLYTPAAPRLAIPGARPVSCGAAAAPTSRTEEPTE